MAPTVIRPQQLPPDLADFTGREEVLAELRDALAQRRRSTPPLVVVSGVAGLGKTTFAVHLAHQVREFYPDGQLFLTLGNGGVFAALRRSLHALRVPGDLVPEELEECSALLRDLLVGRRVLLVVDNAECEAQVRPLLPADPGCAVLVTSRQTLGGLAAARRVSLNLFDDDDAADLLTRITGAPPGARLVTHCGGLPLALRIAGALLADRPHWTAEDLVARLAAERTRLDWLKAGDLAVRASFATSYDQLPLPHQTLFRRLGLLHAPTFGGWLAAALLDTGQSAAERVLEDLVSWHLVEVVRCGAGRTRYRLHDLLRCFAVEQSDAEPPDEQHAAVARALGGWLALTERMAARLPANILTPEPGTALRHPVEHPCHEDPIGWFEAELPALQAAVELAAARGLAEHAWELAMACQQFFDHCGLNDAWLRCTSTVLPAVPGGRGRAALLRGLGQLHIYWDRFAEAFEALRESLAVSQQCRDLPGVARALTGLATAYRFTGDEDGALAHYAKALGLLGEVGDRHGEIHVRTGIAMCHVAAGRPDEAQVLLSEAVPLCARLGDEHLTAAVLRQYGAFHLARLEPAQALRYLLQALEIVESLRDKRCTAQVRMRVGRAHAMLGDTDEAMRVLVGAREMFLDLGDGKGESDCALVLGELAGRR